MKNLLLLLLMSNVLIAQPTCSVEVTNGKYNTTIISSNPRIPEVISTVDVPEMTPIVHDSYFNACIVFGDENGINTHKPVQYTLVTLFGYPDAEWGLDINTSEAGCFDVKIPSDSNFTMKAMNPNTNEWARLGGTILSAGVGELLDDARQKVVPFPSTLKYSAEAGITEHTISGDTLVFKGDMDHEKHSMVVSIPTVAGKKYVVSMKINQPLWVWFSSGVREVNPAKLTGDKGLDHIVKLNPFTAKDEETNLYLQVQNRHTITVKNITVTVEETQ